ncbi:hypothetical protein MPER_01432, partial [Moniliophthora perniciosa FA553]
DDSDSDSDVELPPGPITGPITFTQVRTLSTIPGTTTTRSSTRATIRTTSSSSSSTLTSTSTSATTASTSTPVQQPSASAIPQTSTSSTTTSPTAGSENAQSTSLGTRALSGGAIAGIAIAVVIVVSAIIVFLVRKRMVAHRKDNRSNWGTIPPPAMTTVPLTTPAVEAFRDAYPRSASPPPPVPPVPHILIQGVDGDRGSVSIPPPPAQALAPAPFLAPPSAYNTLPPPPPIIGGTIVRRTFIPNMDDELWITTGETIKVLQDYDDGWALCENAQMQRGMVPLECLDDPGGKRESRPNLSRASSLSHRSKCSV